MIRNGALQTVSYNGTIPATTSSSAQPITIDDESAFWNGVIDKVRISNSARSADWIITEYNNQNSPSTFYTVGSAFTR